MVAAHIHDCTNFSSFSISNFQYVSTYNAGCRWFSSKSHEVLVLQTYGNKLHGMFWNKMEFSAVEKNWCHIKQPTQRTYCGFAKQTLPIKISFVEPFNLGNIKPCWGGNWVSISVSSQTQVKHVNKPKEVTTHIIFTYSYGMTMRQSMNIP